MSVKIATNGKRQCRHQLETFLEIDIVAIINGFIPLSRSYSSSLIQIMSIKKC